MPGPGGSGYLVGQQAVVHRDGDLAHDVQAIPEQQVVVSVDAAPERVLHRQHRPICHPLSHGLEGDLELLAWDRLAAVVGSKGGAFTVCTRDALMRGGRGERGEEEGRTGSE